MQDMTADLVKLAEAFEDARKAGKDKQRAVHEELAGKMLSGLRSEVSGRINDANGRIAGYQQRYVGSGGGYAAVRATDSSTGANSPGALTNYLENGHAIRRPGGGAKRYKPRIRTLYVTGRGFYAAYRGQLGTLVQQAAEQISNAVAVTIEGG